MPDVGISIKSFGMFCGMSGYLRACAMTADGRGAVAEILPFFVTRTSVGEGKTTARCAVAIVVPLNLGRRNCQLGGRAM